MKAVLALALLALTIGTANAGGAWQWTSRPQAYQPWANTQTPRYVSVFEPHETLLLAPNKIGEAVTQEEKCDLLAEIATMTYDMREFGDDRDTVMAEFDWQAQHTPFLGPYRVSAVRVSNKIFEWSYLASPIRDNTASMIYTLCQKDPKYWLNQ